MPAYLQTLGAFAGACHVGTALRGTEASSAAELHPREGAGGAGGRQPCPTLLLLQVGSRARSGGAWIAARAGHGALPLGKGVQPEYPISCPSPQLRRRPAAFHSVTPSSSWGLCPPCQVSDGSTQGAEVPGCRRPSSSSLLLPFVKTGACRVFSPEPGHSWGRIPGAGISTVQRNALEHTSHWIPGWLDLNVLLPQSPPGRTRTLTQALQAGAAGMRVRRGLWMGQAGNNIGSPVLPRRTAAGVQVKQIPPGDR